MITYQNGNATITLDTDGTRTIEYDGDLQLDMPTNIDIRVMTYCPLGLNPATGKSFCSFCHESARIDGEECDYFLLRNQLGNLPGGIELAIGANIISDDLVSFITWATKVKNYVVNLTINQGVINRFSDDLKFLVINDLIKGLGVSYRSSIPFNIPEWILEYNNTVFHVIAGIDSISDVQNLSSLGVNKILVLGEKDFGYNIGNVDLTSQLHKEWYWYLPRLFNLFYVVSFDNLALDQLKVNRFLTDIGWNIFNQGEHSFYINAVDKYFSPSSRSSERTDWSTTSIQDYFKALNRI